MSAGTADGGVSAGSRVSGVDLSIVVLNWNGEALLDACLDSIDRELRRREGAGRIEIETLVVDNGSSDGSVAMVRERHPWVRLVPLPENRGFAAGNNEGLRRARGRHAVLLNNDTVLLPDALERCLLYLDEHPDVGVVGPQLVHPDGRAQNSIHNFPGLDTELLPRGLLETLLPRRYPSKRARFERPVEVEAVLGACLMVRRGVWEGVGTMPEDYFFFLEETDWCFQIRRAGWKIVHLPDARVIHHLGATSKKQLPAETRIEYHRSLYHFLRKNRGAGVAACVIGVRVVKGLFYAVSGALLAPFSVRQRGRWQERCRVLAWHLRGCPRDAGLQHRSRLGQGATS